VTLERINGIIATYPVGTKTELALKTCYKCSQPAQTTGLTERKFVCADCCFSDNDSPAVPPMLYQEMARLAQ